MRKPNKNAQNGGSSDTKPERYRHARTTADFDLASISGQVVRLNRMPLVIPPDCFPAYIGRSPQGRAVLLVSVDNLNKVPKGLAHRVQTVFPFWEQKGEQLVLVTGTGKIYAVMHNL